MPKTCTICIHEKRAEIEVAVLKGLSLRDIARQFQTSKDSIARHVASHIQASVKQSKEAKEEARGLDVVKQLKDINVITLSILQSARSQEGKEFLALQAIDRVCKQLELQSKLLGDIDEQHDKDIDPALTQYMTDEDIITIKNIVRRAKEKKDEAEEKIIPIRRQA